MYNQQRTALAALISYQTTRQIDAVPQAVAGAQFEIASEFGVPQGHRVPKDILSLAYDFEDFDQATRFTWKYLRDADSRQVGAVHNSILEGANRATTTAVLERLFDPTQSQSPEGNTIYGLYNGDGMFIPPYLGTEFDPDTDTHYLTTGSAVLDPSDVETLLTKVSSKGFSAESGRKLLILANPIEAKMIATFRAGEPGADGVEAHFDFIPSSAAPPRLVTEQIIGDQAPGEWNGLAILGSYGDAYVIQSAFIPKGYVAVVASAGPWCRGQPRRLPSPHSTGIPRASLDSWSRPALPPHLQLLRNRVRHRRSTSRRCSRSSGHDQCGVRQADLPEVGNRGYEA
ncbi:hypothetical protein [Rhodococcus sp. NPDC055024]